MTVATNSCACPCAASSTKEQKVNLNKIREELVGIFEGNGKIGPTLVRVAWHASASFSGRDGSGGSDGGRIRFKPESAWVKNTGLDKAVAVLDQVQKNNPEITHADLYIFAGVTMIEIMGGPKVPFRLGRKDAPDGSTSPPDDRLPSADKGCPVKTAAHVRDVFSRLGFNDRETVALIGAHAVGRAHPELSGFSGPWTETERKFSNKYFKNLLNVEWKPTEGKSPTQFNNPSKTLIMLPSDMVLIQDEAFRPFVKLYAQNEELFFKDFAVAFQKVTENGVNFED